MAASKNAAAAVAVAVALLSPSIKGGAKGTPEVAATMGFGCRGRGGRGSNACRLTAEASSSGDSSLARFLLLLLLTLTESDKYL